MTAYEAADRAAAEELFEAVNKLYEQNRLSIHFVTEAIPILSRIYAPERALTKELLEALQTLIDAHPVHRRPLVGWQGSYAAQKQEKRIAAEEAALKVISKAKEAGL